MGLDMYAYCVNAKAVTHDFGDALKDELKLAQKIDKENGDLRDVSGQKSLFYAKFGYWRKFNHFHGWMENLYRGKGGNECFNCVPVRLTLADLDRLENDLEKGLKPTAGFFFGDETLYPEDVESLTDFIQRSRTAINNGYAVIYDSWW